MRLEHYPVKKLKKEILGILEKHLDLKKFKVFFFGSRVAGKGTDHSDIDIGIEGPEPVPYEFMAQIQEELENLPTLYKIEVVDFHEVSAKFKKVALQQIELLNTK